VSLKREGNAKSTTTDSKSMLTTNFFGIPTNFFGIPKKNVTTFQH
jgi:hypothetical protein